MLRRLILAALVCALPLPALAAYGGPGVAAGGTNVNYGDLLFCTVVTTSPTYTAGQTQACSQDTGGDIRVVELNNLATSAVPGTSSTKAQGVQGVTGGVPLRDTIVGSSAAADGILPTVSTGTSQVAKNAQGNLFTARAVLTVAASATTYLVAVNLAAAPASGATITPLDFDVFTGTAVGSKAGPGVMDYGSGPPNAFSTGIVLLVTTSLTTYTPGAASLILSRVR